MRDHNQVSLVGRMAQNAELRYAPGGLAICQFTLAVNRRRKNGDRYEDEGNFFNCTLFGTYGQNMQPHLLKGKQILVEGELRQHRWTTDDGKNRSFVSVAANFIQFLRNPGDRPEGTSQGAPAGREPAPPPTYEAEDYGFDDDDYTF